MIAIVDYKAGNLTSVRLALDSLNVEAVVTSDPQVVADADRVIFPGVGAAEKAVENIDAMGLRQVLLDSVASGKPFLGICLGTQILLDFSEEDGGTDCLGIIPGKVVRFQPTDHFDKIPQMGWNTVNFKTAHPVFRGIEDGSEFYFVHSFYCMPENKDHWLGVTTYAGVEFASAVGHDNLVATQFHPERSGRIGQLILKNFAEWDGSC